MSTPRIAYVTTDADYLAADPDVDLPLALPALAEAGLHATAEVWHDPAVDWARYDALVIRSPWDYVHRPARFLEWLDARAAEVPVMNCPHTIRWNLDKRYLLELADAGVAVVPTTVCTTPEEVAEALVDLGDAGVTEVVVKPTVSAGSKDTGRFAVHDPAALDLGDHVLAKGVDAMVQPCVATVAEVGERSLVHFDGRFSHTLSKGPLLELGGGLVGGEYRETIEPATCTAAEHDLADQTEQIIPELVRRHGCTCPTAVPLYARYDVVVGDEGPLLLEAELFEPCFFLPTSPDAAHDFARAVADRLSTVAG